MKHICVLPGDGIGPEVVSCAVEVLKHATDQLDYAYADIGQAAMEKYGSGLPDETLDLMIRSDSCLFGAVTSPPGGAPGSPVLRFRKELDLFANLRPVKNFLPIQGRPPIDVVIVRENSEGMYTQREEIDDEGVTTLRRVTRKASERIISFAILHALENGRKRICCVHKANVLTRSDGLFLEMFRNLMKERQGRLNAEEQLVDSAALKLVTDPAAFDMIVTLNLYGDILSDVAAAVAGGLGFGPSGNIGPKHSVFEPIHGSAPDIAGRGIANPTAAILAGAMMLRHLGFKTAATAIETAVAQTYATGHLTMDIGGRHDSRSFTDHVVKNLPKDDPGPVASS